MNDNPPQQLDLLNVENSADADASPRIRVSRRARRLAVRVYPDARVEVVVPPRVRPREVELFLQAHREWIDDKRAAALARRPPPEPFPPAALRFELTQETWRLHWAAGSGRARLAELPGSGGGILQLSGPVGLQLRCAREPDWATHQAPELRTAPG